MLPATDWGLLCLVYADGMQDSYCTIEEKVNGD